MIYFLLILLFIVDVVMIVFHPANRTDLTVRNILLIFFYGGLNAAIILAGKEVFMDIKHRYRSKNKNGK